MPARFHLIVGLATSLLLASAIDALADKNIALVIGNSSYQRVSKLPNRDNFIIAYPDRI